MFILEMVSHACLDANAKKKKNGMGEKSQNDKNLVVLHRRILLYNI